MPVPESQYVCCLDCKRGPKYHEFGQDTACSAGWRVRTRKSGGCYVGERIPGTKAKKGEQGYVHPSDERKRTLLNRRRKVIPIEEKKKS